MRADFRRIRINELLRNVSLPRIGMRRRVADPDDEPPEQINPNARGGISAHNQIGIRD